MEKYRNKRGMLLRNTRVNWEKRQSNPKPSCMTSLKELDDVKKEDDLIGYTTLKLKVLQVAAQELLDAWKADGDTGEYARLVQAMGRLADAVKQTKVGRRLEQGRS